MQSLALGTIIDGKYELICSLGRGGFGSIFRAKHLQLDREVAIKLLNPEVLQEADGLGRFEREAKTISTLKHKNVVSFYGYGVWNGSPYMVMEYIEGQSLEARIQSDGALDQALAARIILQICEALDSAHSHGIVHRDLKPSNIMLESGPDGKELVRIIDFGLAKLMPGYGLPAQKLTEAGFAIGTCHYMSPEQCTGVSVDHRADIYSTGCILYHALTGHPPFEADEGVAVMFMHLNQPATPVSELFPDSDSRLKTLSAIVDRAMHKEPEMRYQSASEMSSDLQAYLDNKPVTARQSSERIRPSNGKPTALVRRILVPCLVTVIGLSVLGLWFLSRQKLVDSPQVSSLEYFNQLQRSGHTLSSDKRLALIKLALRANAKDDLLEHERCARLYRELGVIYGYMNEDKKAVKAMQSALEYKHLANSRLVDHQVEVFGLVEAYAMAKQFDKATALMNSEEKRHSLELKEAMKVRFDLSQARLLDYKGMQSAARQMADRYMSSTDPGITSLPEISYFYLLASRQEFEKKNYKFARELAEKSYTRCQKVLPNVVDFRNMALRAALIAKDYERAAELLAEETLRPLEAKTDAHYFRPILYAAAAARAGDIGLCRRFSSEVMSNPIRKEFTGSALLDEQLCAAAMAGPEFAEARQTIEKRIGHRLRTSE